MTKECVFCKKDISHRDGRAKYCNDSCKKKQSKLKSLDQIEKEAAYQQEYHKSYGIRSKNNLIYKKIKNEESSGKIPVLEYKFKPRCSDEILTKLGY